MSDEMLRMAIVVEVPRAWMEQRVRESWDEYGDDPPEAMPTPEEYMGGRLCDVCDDELPLALFSWPAEFTVTAWRAAGASGGDQP